MIKLGIIDYNDYIYNVSSNTRVLNTILEHNPELQAKTTSVVLADIIHQNAQLIGVLLAPQPKGSVLRSSPCFSALPKGGALRSAGGRSQRGGVRTQQGGASQQKGLLVIFLQVSFMFLFDVVIIKSLIIQVKHGNFWCYFVLGDICIFLCFCVFFISFLFVVLALNLLLYFFIFVYLFIFIFVLLFCGAFFELCKACYIFYCFVIFWFLRRYLCVISFKILRWGVRRSTSPYKIFKSLNKM